MKSVEFGEEQLQNLQEIGAELFGDEEDPRSFAYVRKLERPKIHWLRIVWRILCPLFVLPVVSWGLYKAGMQLSVCISVPIVLFIGYVLWSAKAALLCLIRIYQRYAPASLRNKCRFEPSCSQYMVLAIEKYGLMKGLQKGIGRLKRCNVNGGGIDFP